jgi:NDP-sugar pyrophosphorylase family protein
VNFPDHLTAVILAGGLGTRLREVVADRPKVLADVAEKPFLSYLFDQLLHVILEFCNLARSVWAADIILS